MIVPWDMHHLTLYSTLSPQLCYSLLSYSLTHLLAHRSKLIQLSTMSVDQTPLNLNFERRNSLEKHLQTRPGMQDLKNRHILLDTNVAPYISQK